MRPSIAKQSTVSSGAKCEPLEAMEDAININKAVLYLLALHGIQSDTLTDESILAGLGSLAAKTGDDLYAIFCDVHDAVHQLERKP